MVKAKKGLKKSLAVLLAAVLALSSMWCFTAFAADGDVSYIGENGEEQTVSEGEYTSVTEDGTTWETGTYVVDEDVTVETRITVSGNVTLILVDGKTLTASKGINVGTDQSLTIYAQSEGTGALVANAEASYAAIGGNTGSSNAVLGDCGHITINGGVITATGGTNAAGIGGGSNEGDNADEASVITINGGTVTAAGGNNGAGIGGGRIQNSGTANIHININGGVVTATGGGSAAGIGGGTYDHGDVIDITGGVVTATGGTNSAGIGGGYQGSCGNIKISGGYVNATGGNLAAGIGDGNQDLPLEGQADSSIVISGGTVIATAGGTSAYGIGTGNNDKDTISFSTGENGCAVIYASSIYDNNGGTSEWSGLISADNVNGPAIIYGTPVTITVAEEIPEGKTALLEANKRLIIGDGTTLTNNGTIYRNYGGTFTTSNTTFTNNGTVYHEIADTSGAGIIFTDDTETETYDGEIYAVHNTTVTAENKTTAGKTIINYTVQDKDGNKVEVEDLAFTMPNHPVAITAVTYDCIEEYGDHDFDYENGEVTKEPTCTAKGETTYTCTRCGETETLDDIAALGHAYDITTAPDDPEEDTDGYKYVDIVWDTTDPNNPTCTATFHCKDCNYSTAKYCYLSNTGKNYIVADEGNKAATCTVDGTYKYTAYPQIDHDPRTDTYGLVAPTTIEFTTEAPGHDIVEVKSKAATCTEDGNELYYICTVCGEKFEDEYGRTSLDDDNEEYFHPALGHNYSVEKDADGNYLYVDFEWENDLNGVEHSYQISCEATFTCTACGYTETVECDVTYEPSGDHDATCTTPDDYDVRATASIESRDGEVTATEDEFIEGVILGHAWSAEFVWAEDYSSCTVKVSCANDSDHDFEATLGEDDITATYTVGSCTEADTVSFAAVFTFTDDNGLEFTFTDETDVLTVDGTGTGHVYERVEAVAPTCTEDGNIEYYECSVCGALFILNGEEYEKVTAEDVVNLATGHTFPLEVVEAVAPTCVAEGNIEYYYCSACGMLFADDGALVEITAEDTVLAAVEHTYEMVYYVNSTCTEDGAVYYACVCDCCEECECNNETVEDADGNEFAYIYVEVLQAPGHDFTETVVDPTCEEQGYTLHVCGVCGYEYQDNFTEATGHTFPLVKFEADPATCTEDGTIAYYVCEACGKMFADEDGEEELDQHEIVVPALGHNFSAEKDGDEYLYITFTWEHADVKYVDDDVITCTATFHCTDCDYTEDVTCTVTHNTQNDDEATCTDAADYDMNAAAEIVNPRNDEIVTATEDKFLEGVALGHDWGEPVFTWAEDYSSCEATITCSRDEEHTITAECYVTSVTENPTCTTDGSTVYTATVTFTDEDGAEIGTFSEDVTEVIPATGHDWSVEFDWADDYSMCDAIFTCNNNGCGAEERVKCEVTSDITEVTCEKDGSAIYTATVEYEGKTYEDVQEVTTPALGHNYDYENATIMFTASGNSAYAFVDCLNDCDSEQLMLTCEVSTETTKVATCSETGITTTTVTYVGLDGVTYTQVFESEISIDKANHNYSADAVFNWSDDCSKCSATFTCEDCGYEETVICEIVKDTDPTDEATCTDPVDYTVTATATIENPRDGQEITAEDTALVYGEALGHAWQATFTWSDAHDMCTVDLVCSRCGETAMAHCVVEADVKAATCEEAGYESYTATAEYDGQTFTDTYSAEYEALGHDWDYANAEYMQSDSGDWYAIISCANDASHLTYQKCDVDEIGNVVPTCTEIGSITYEISFTVDDEKYTDSKPYVVELSIDPENHNYSSDSVVFTWDKDTAETIDDVTCSAIFICTDCGMPSEAVDCDVTGNTQVDHEATCTTPVDWDVVATATIVNPRDGETVTAQDEEEITGVALGHTWGVVFTWADDYSMCDATFTCSVCGETDDTAKCEITADINPATCENGGSAVYTATVEYDGETYSDTQTVEYEALGHNYDYANAEYVMAEDGNFYAIINCLNYADGVACEEPTIAFICTLTLVERVEPTCSALGSEKYEISFTVDGETFTDSELYEVTLNYDLDNHNYSEDSVEFVWNEDYTECDAYFTCTDCEDHTVKAECVVETSNEVEATCTTPDECDVTATATVENPRDGETVTASDTVHLTGEALGHDYGEPVFTWADDYSTCEATISCSRGDSELTADCHVSSDITKYPTCTEEGEIVYTAWVDFALNDNDSYIEAYAVNVEYTDVQVVAIPATGHDYVLVEAVEPTCTEDGNIEYYECSVCGALFILNDDGEYEEVTDVVDPATGHDYVLVEAVEPTCTEDGNIEYYECSVCGTLFILNDDEEYEEITAEDVVVPATGHTVVTDEAVEPTCTETGLTEGSHCDVCGEVFTAQEVVDALGHTEVIDEAVEPTCTEDGLTEGSHCAVCGEVFTAQEVVPATGHTPGAKEYESDTYTSQTDAEDGSIDWVIRCTVCGEILEYGTEVIPANGHTAGEKEYDEDSYVAPTETEDGSIDWVIRCTDCGEILETGTEVIPATGVTSDGSTTAGGSSTTAHSGLVAVEVVDPETGETYTVYYDPDTGIYYSDAEGTIEIDADSFILLEDYEEDEEDEELDEDEDEDEEETEVKADTSETSPNTGASLAALAIAMGTAAAGIVVVSRKKKEEE